MNYTAIAASLFAIATFAHAEEKPKLQIINGTKEPVEIFWLKSDAERVPSGTVRAGRDLEITTTLGHRFAIVGHGAEVAVTSLTPFQAVRFDPPNIEGVPAFYTQAVRASGFPIVASARRTSTCRCNLAVNARRRSITWPAGLGG